MAETDILNPQTGYWDTLGDNPNPSYGFTRKTNANSLLSKTRLGSWYQRDNANSGYAFAMSFMSRPWTTMLRLKQFYEIGKNGYFTYIDYDGGGRHHVGRFTAEPNPVQMQNAKYNCQSLIFEEIPQARMLTYPSDTGNWGKNIYVLDDFLKQTAPSQGAWALQQTPFALILGSAVTAPSSYELFNAAPAIGDFVQMQYVGWGFVLSLRMGSAMGVCDIYVDGTLAIYGIDLFATNAPPDNTPPTLTGYVIPGQSVSPELALPAVGVYILDAITNVDRTETTYLYEYIVTMIAMPLDNHRVKVVPRGTKNPASTGTGVSFAGLQVIV